MFGILDGWDAALLSWASASVLGCGLSWMVWAASASLLGCGLSWMVWPASASLLGCGFTCRSLHVSPSF